MEQLVYINDEHKRIIEDYMTFVQKEVYEVTETAKCGKFGDFQELLHDIMQYHNDFFDIALKKVELVNGYFLFLIYVCLW